MEHRAGAASIFPLRWKKRDEDEDDEEATPAPLPTALLLLLPAKRKSRFTVEVVVAAVVVDAVVEKHEEDAVNTRISSQKVKQKDEKIFYSYYEYTRCSRCYFTI